MNDLLKRYLFKNSEFKYSKFWVIAFILSMTNANTQNLVLNGSFEEYVECPSEASQIELAFPWYSPNVINNGDEGDYYNTCAPINSIFHLPEMNGQYFLLPKQGDAVAGIISFNHFGSNYREYITGQLNQLLNYNVNYRVKYYLSAQLHTGNKFVVNGFGLNFSSSPLSLQNSEIGVGSVLDFSNFINLYNDPIISDSSWVLIEGLYKAMGDEKYITIGNHLTDSQINYEIININGYPGAYYFIDDVSVEEITEPFWQYHDTTIYYGDSVLIGPALTGLDINWYTANDEFLENAPGIYVQPATSRNYIAKETFNGVETTHVVHVTVIGGAGIGENELEQMVVYPNPAKDEFFISGVDSHELMEIVVRDLNGKIVSKWEKNLANGTNVFAINVDNGIYFVNVINPITNESSVEKLVIHK